MFLKNVSIGRRMGLVLGLILVLSAVGSLYGVVQLRSVSSNTDNMLTDNVQTERQLADWLRISSANMTRSIAVALSNDSTLADYFAPAMAESSRRSLALQEQITPRMDTAEEIALHQKAQGTRQAYIAVRDDVAKLKKAGDPTGARKLFDAELAPKAAAYLSAVQALAESQRTQLDDAGKNIQTASERATVVLLGCCVVSLVLGVLLAWTLSRSITTPLRLADDMARAIAALDLTQAAQTAYSNDETGRLLRSIDSMREALTRQLNDVRGVADSISTASSQIAVGNQDLSTRTEQTAGNLQQAASAMEELTGTVRQSAETASQANQLAASAARVAERGGEVVAKVVTTMNEINTSSKRIADIIGTIDGIAFQTNILALNAAVEAARAGEQGRGFAVVASEVRSLAQRSAEAAKEIKNLIGQSVDKVETGSRLVEDAGTTMTEIVQSVKRVTDLIAEITAAASEQSQGIGDVNGTVTQLDQMTQQNAALVEESTAAAESLREQAQRLSAVVGTFRLVIKA